MEGGVPPGADEPPAALAELTEARHRLRCALAPSRYRGVLAGSQKLAAGEVVRGADSIAAAVPYVRRVRGSVLGMALLWLYLLWLDLQWLDLQWRYVRWLYLQ